jgi:hypothetical protein
MLAHSFWSYKRGNLFGRKGCWDYGRILELYNCCIWADMGVCPYGRGVHRMPSGGGAASGQGAASGAPTGGGREMGAEVVHHPSLKAGA